MPAKRKQTPAKRARRVLTRAMLNRLINYAQPCPNGRSWLARRPHLSPYAIATTADIGWVRWMLSEGRWYTSLALALDREADRWVSAYPYPWPASENKRMAWARDKKRAVNAAGRDWMVANWPQVRTHLLARYDRLPARVRAGTATY